MRWPPAKAAHAKHHDCKEKTAVLLLRRAELGAEGHAVISNGTVYRTLVMNGDPWT